MRVPGADFLLVKLHLDPRVPTALFCGNKCAGPQLEWSDPPHIPGYSHTHHIYQCQRDTTRNDSTLDSVSKTSTNTQTIPSVRAIPMNGAMESSLDA